MCSSDLHSFPTRRSSDLTYNQLAGAYQEAGEDDKAVAAYGQAVAHFTAADDNTSAANVLEGLGRSYRAAKL